MSGFRVFVYQRRFSEVFAYVCVGLILGLAGCQSQQTHRLIALEDMSSIEDWGPHRDQWGEWTIDQMNRLIEGQPHLREMSQSDEFYLLVRFSAQGGYLRATGFELEPEPKNPNYIPTYIAVSRDSRKIVVASNADKPTSHWFLVVTPGETSLAYNRRYIDSKASGDNFSLHTLIDSHKNHEYHEIDGLIDLITWDKEPRPFSGSNSFGGADLYLEYRQRQDERDLNWQVNTGYLVGELGPEGHEIFGAIMSRIYEYACLGYPNYDVESGVFGQHILNEVKFDRELKSTSMHLAARHNDVMGLIEAQREGHDIDGYDFDGFTPLYRAAALGNVEAVAWLLNHGAEHDQLCSGGLVAIHGAAIAGSVPIVELLLKHGANIHIRDMQWQYSALSWACKVGAADVVSTLLQNDADPHGTKLEDFDEYRGSPLVLAAEAGSLDIVQQLLDAGADPNARNEETALMYAATTNLEIVKLLLEEGAEVNARARRGRTALLSASGYGQIETVKVLLEAGAEVNVMSDGHSPLSLAAWRGSIDIVRLLLAHGAEVNVKTDGFFLSYPLTIAVSTNQIEIVQLLLNAGADVDAQFLDHETALEVAERNQYIELIEILQAAR